MREVGRLAGSVYLVGKGMEIGIEEQCRDWSACVGSRVDEMISSISQIN